MPVQSLLDLAGEHRRAVVGQQGPRQASLHQGLAKPVDEDLGGLLQIPLKMTAGSGRRGSRIGVFHSPEAVSTRRLP